MVIFYKWILPGVDVSTENKLSYYSILPEDKVYMYHRPTTHMVSKWYFECPQKNLKEHAGFFPVL